MKKLFSFLFILFIFSFLYAEDQTICYKVKKIYSATEYLLNCDYDGHDQDFKVQLKVRLEPGKKIKRWAYRYIQREMKKAPVVILDKPLKIGKMLKVKDVMLRGESVKEYFEKKKWAKKYYY